MREGRQTPAVEEQRGVCLWCDLEGVLITIESLLPVAQAFAQRGLVTASSGGEETERGCHLTSDRTSLSICSISSKLVQAITSVRPPMSNFHWCYVFLSVLLFFTQAFAQYFPETGRAAIYQQSLDARSRLHVLSIALKPGYEDLATIAYFRLGRGARVVSAYVTNGEAGESDVRGEYPHQLAAVRREEAARAAAHLGAEEYFLTMPDIAAAADTAAVRVKWQADSLQTRLMNLISVFRPDVILVSRDWALGGGSPCLQVLREELLKAVRRIRPLSSPRGSSPLGPYARWSVDRILIDAGGSTGAKALIDQVHPHWKKSYRDVGQEAARAYASLAVQRRQWYEHAGFPDSLQPQVTYEQIYPQRSQLKSVDQGLPGRIPQRLAGIESEIKSLTGATLRGQTSIQASGGKRERVLSKLAAVVDSLDWLLSRPAGLTVQERKITLYWKLALEDLRVALLGVSVRYTLAPTILAERQLTLLKIDTVTGIRGGGTSYLYFPVIDQGWVINESLQQKLPLELHNEYRLLSPAHLDYDLPSPINGLNRTSVGRLFVFFVVHEAKNREESFMYKVAIPLLFCPRFTVEVLSPIVRVTPNELLPLRLTNHSRDGVRDSVHVDDSLAVAPKREFRLNIKDESELDTLVLSWRRPLAEGTYLVPVMISMQEVARFAARQFEAKVDTTRRIGLITGIESSPTADALRRLGVKYTLTKFDADAPADLNRFHVILVDRRALTLDSGLVTRKDVFERFVEGGGRLIVLAQDAEVWNAWNLVDGLNLIPTAAYDEETSVEADSTHRLMSYPNVIGSDDWLEWLFRRAFNVVTGPALELGGVPVRTAADHRPLIGIWKRGTGTLTYVDLALHPQFLNIHPGAYRLLANLLSY